MAASLLYLCSTFRARSCHLLQTKLLCSKTPPNNDSTKKSKKSNLYETLGVPSNATYGEIKKAYYDLTFKYHPDRNESCDVSSTKFREVKEAYEILGNYGLRKKYDKGESVSHMKKTVSVTEDHKAKFQEFYDSRTARKEFNDRTADYNDFAAFSEKKKDNSRDEKKAEVKDSTFGQQFAITIFLFIAVFLMRK